MRTSEFALVRYAEGGQRSAARERDVQWGFEKLDEIGTRDPLNQQQSDVASGSSWVARGHGLNDRIERYISARHDIRKHRDLARNIKI